jgi:hypothetical protein
MPDTSDSNGAGRWMGAALIVGTAVVGQVQGVVRDAISGRVRHLVTSYDGQTDNGRRVAVPIEWVVGHTSGRVVLGVGTRELDRLPGYREPPRVVTRTTRVDKGAARA